MITIPGPNPRETCEVSASAFADRIVIRQDIHAVTVPPESAPALIAALNHIKTLLELRRQRKHQS